MDRYRKYLYRSNIFEVESQPKYEIHHNRIDYDCIKKNRDKFTRFEKYNFDKDPDYQKIYHVNSNSTETNIIKLKIWFYNKYIEELDFNEYHNWLKSNQDLS